MLCGDEQWKSRSRSKLTCHTLLVQPTIVRNLRIPRTRNAISRLRKFSDCAEHIYEKKSALQLTSVGLASARPNYTCIQNRVRALRSETMHSPKTTLSYKTCVTVQTCLVPHYKKKCAVLARFVYLSFIPFLENQIKFLICLESKAGNGTSPCLTMHADS